MAKLTDFIDQADIKGYLEEDDEVVQAEVELAKQAVSYAKSIAPVETGNYRNSIRVGRRGNRGVVVEFAAPHAHLVEFGTEDQEPNPVRAKTENHLSETQ